MDKNTVNGIAMLTTGVVLLTTQVLVTRKLKAIKKQRLAAAEAASEAEQERVMVRLNALSKVLDKQLEKAKFWDIVLNQPEN